LASRENVDQTESGRSILETIVAKLQSRENVPWYFTPVLIRNGVFRNQAHPACQLEEGGQHILRDFFNDANSRTLAWSWLVRYTAKQSEGTTLVFRFRWAID